MLHFGVKVQVSKHLCEQKCVFERGRSTFWRASIWVVVGVRVINGVTVGGGKATGIDKVLVGLSLTGCRRGRDV